MTSAAVTAVGDTLNPVDGDRGHPLRGVPSTAAIGGHPIHPMVVPYPIAFLTGAVASDLAARSTEDPFWARMSKWMLGAGIVTGLAAGAVGAVDYFTIKRAREKKTGKLHAYGNPLALGLAGASLFARRGDDDAAPSDTALALSAATAGMVMLTGWAGAELSYRHMVGVIGANDQHDHAEKQLVH
ncbi:MAG TPA: DUF2231 domain-containing protein [Sphingomonas sp.]|jgi:uncharacterized membrane protein|uniref:DUF2231 domain-containing protein n=1 Tax=Sphingomonas sp. TaxID=28214 RepID=UPI002EDA4D5D